MDFEDKPTNYNQLIHLWYWKATTEDYFSKFIFLYLAFDATLRKKYFVNSMTDRDGITSLKNALQVKREYLKVIKLEGTVLDELNSLIRELNKSPLKNISRNNGKIEEITIKNIDDWDNIIEFIYVVRNNLFHGEKSPESFRDIIMVKFAYILLKQLVELLISYEPSYLGVDDTGIRMVKTIMEKVRDEQGLNQ